MNTTDVSAEKLKPVRKIFTAGFDFAEANVPKAQTTDPRSLGERPPLDWDFGDFISFYLRFVFINLPRYLFGVAFASAQGLIIYGCIFLASIVAVKFWITRSLLAPSWEEIIIGFWILVTAYFFFFILNIRDWLWRYQPIVPTWELLGPRSLISRFLRNIRPNDLHFGFLNVRYAFNDTTFFVVSGDTLAACAFDFTLMKKASISNDPQWRGSSGTSGIEILIASGTKRTKLNIHGSYFEDGGAGIQDRDEFIKLLNSHIP